MGKRMSIIQRDVRKVLAIRGRSLLSRLLSATYKFLAADELICSATDAIVDAAGLLSKMKILS